MKLENYVCTLEQAKKLKELGVGRESIFSWFRHSGDSQFDIRRYEEIVLAGYEQVGAYTSQELAEEIFKFCDQFRQNISDDEIRMEAIYSKRLSVICPSYMKIPNITEARARAEFLIYLLENRK
jgi:hypothetical protein